MVVIPHHLGLRKEEPPDQDEVDKQVEMTVVQEQVSLALTLVPVMVVTEECETPPCR